MNKFIVSKQSIQDTLSIQAAEVLANHLQYLLLALMLNNIKRKA